MLHSFDPFAIQFTDTFGLRWYGLSYIAGFIIAFFILQWMAKTNRSMLNQGQVADFITYIAIGILAGGRLGYCVFYSPELIWEFSSQFPFWGVLALNKGGMASHGGIIGIVVASILFSRKHGINTLHLFDLVAITGPIGIFFGRIANFINGELVGRPAPESYPWAVRFPQDIYLWLRYEFERLETLTPVIEQLGLSKEQWLRWLNSYSESPEAQSKVHEVLGQIIQGIQSGQGEIGASIAPLLTPRYPSQLFAAFFEGLLLFVILAAIWWRPRRMGMIAACFLMLYPIMRIFTEQFRMPDPHIGFQMLSLTRGQWLSILMFAIGAVMYFWWQRISPPQAIGGLRSNPKN